MIRDSGSVINMTAYSGFLVILTRFWFISARARLVSTSLSPARARVKFNREHRSTMSAELKILCSEYARKGSHYGPAVMWAFTTHETPYFLGSKRFPYLLTSMHLSGFKKKNTKWFLILFIHLPAQCIYVHSNNR